MKKIDTVVATFVACDGKTFSSEESCLEYEKKLQEEQEFVESGHDYHYIAYKFVYNSDFSFEDYAKILGWRGYRNRPFETIINGELHYSVYMKDIPSLEAGETYIIANYKDLSGDYDIPSLWWFYKLDDFKKYQIEEINKCYEKINSL